jgi:hypothetical protein
MQEWAQVFRECRVPITIFGRFEFDMNVTGNFTVTVAPAGGGGLAMNPQGGNLPAETQGTQSSDKVCDVTGGTKPYSFAVSGGSIPPGMQLTAVDNADGSSSVMIVGTPTQSGAFSFALTVTDSAGAKSTVKVGAA